MPSMPARPKAAALPTGSVGNTTPLLNPVPAIPAPAANPLQSGIRQATAGMAQPNAQPQAAAATAPLGQWAPGANGSPVYPPGQGPVSGQAPKSASLGSLALALYIAKGCSN